MLDVHPPHEAAHTWKDFFIHIATIVIGLCIAVGLEQTVEFFHHRHLLHTAENNLRAEIQDNRTLLASDEQYLNLTQKQIEDGITILAAAKAGKATTEGPPLHWEWDAPQSSSWDTARDNGAVTLMSYEAAQSYAVVYGQQKAVNDQATLYIRDIYNITAPLNGNAKIADLSPATLDTMIANSNQALADLRLLRALCESLDRIYDRSAKL
jgi:hypothetical protein